jgi:hypothetical protein
VSAAEIGRLLDEVTKLPYRSPAAIALLEEAIRIADATNDAQQSYDLRQDVMSRVYYTGDWDKLLLHFGHCISLSDGDPERFSEYDLLWKYKWVVNEAARMPVMGRERVLGLLDDMERRFVAHGSTGRAVHQHRSVALAKLGDLAGVPEAIDLWFDTPRDRLSDCSACELDCRVELLQQLSEHDAAFERATALLDEGRGCAEIPHRTYARTLGYLRRADDARAADHHRRGYRLCKKMQKLVEAHGQHLMHAGVVGDDDEAVTMLERHLPGALSHPCAWERLPFLAAVRHVAKLWRDRGRASLSIRFPKETGLSGTIETDELVDWAAGELRRTAGAFDERNGNTKVSEWVRQWHLLAA